MRFAARRVLPVVFAVMIGLGVLCGAASAEVIHNFKFSFGGQEVPAGSFEGGLSTIAVDQASGDVYVEDWVWGTIYRFDGAGKYLGEITGAAVPQHSLGIFYWYSGIAVDNSSGPDKGDLYVAGTENGVVYRFSSTGTLLSEFNGAATPAGSFGPVGVAVGTTGDVYVADRANHVVDELEASGKYLSQIASPEIVEPSTIAVDSSGDIYLTNFRQSVVKLEPGGGSSVLNTDQPGAVAVDPHTNDVYVSESHYPSPGGIVEYDQSGKRLGVLGEEGDHLGVGSVTGISVSGAGEVYAADNFDQLMAVFGPGVVIPDTTTEAASGVLPASATLNGSVNPDGLPVTSCQLEYGTSVSYSQSASCEQSLSSIGSGTSPVPVSLKLAGLRADTTYHFRLVAGNANGSNRGSDETVTTTGPPQIEAEPSTGITRVKAVLQARVDPSGFDTTYRFEYGTSTSYGTSVPIPDADIGSGTSYVAVSHEIGGLQSGLTYHYRVVAINSQGTVDGPDQAFTTVPPASINGPWALGVTATSATLAAGVNPLGTSTEYRLEYGTSLSYGQVVSGSVGESESEVPVSAHRQDLQPSTTYHYRIVASNVYGTAESADYTFTTQSTNVESSLPDGRQWELVSPANKDGAVIEPRNNGELTQAADSGSAILYAAQGPHLGENPLGAGATFGGSVSQVLSKRGPEGWHSQDITIPLPPQPPEGSPDRLIVSNSETYSLFSRDLSQAVLYAQGLLAPGVDEQTLYLRDNSSEGSYTPLVSQTDVPPGTKYGPVGHGTPEEYREYELYVLDATPDLSHVVFETPLALTPEAASGTESRNLYEWSAGRLQLVNILPDGSVLSGKTGSEGAIFGGEAAPGEGLPDGGVERAMSSDGRRIAWTWNTPWGEDYNGLYVRDMVEKKTVRVGGANAVLQSMNSEGSRIFYVEGGDLYEYDFATGAEADLTPNHGAGESSAGLQELAVVSEDGSYVYFVADGVLSAAPNAEGEPATPGHCVHQKFINRETPPSATCNLYVLHNSGGVWEAPRFIASLSGADEATWYTYGTYGSPTLSKTASGVSPNGHYFTFMSERSLTGYDNRDAVNGQSDEEVYLYDAAANRLVCASCDPTGARPVGVFDRAGSEGFGGTLLVDRGSLWAEASNEHWLAGSIPGSHPAYSGKATAYHARYLSNGGRLFFNSPDALVPQATNGLEDVYEYEPPAGGEASESDTCTTGSSSYSARSGGCVSLISSGISSAESVFYDASENGDDVFFATAGKLVSEDYDDSYDVYDAHVCSAQAPCRAVPVSSPPCTSGDSCKAAPSPQPEIFGPAPSATFNGVGNVVEETNQSTVKHKAKKPKRKAAKKKAKKKRRTKTKGVKARRSATRTASRKGQG
jgi:hypothetical protein